MPPCVLASPAAAEALCLHLDHKHSPLPYTQAKSLSFITAPPLHSELRFLFFISSILTSGCTRFFSRHTTHNCLLHVNIQSGHQQASPVKHHSTSATS